MITKSVIADEIKEEFEILWNLYPRKMGKFQALRDYAKVRKSGVTFEEIKRGIENYNEYIKFYKIETQFIKYGSSWFARRCWHDEY